MCKEMNVISAQGVVKDHAQRVPVSRQHLADSVLKVNPVMSVNAAGGPEVGWKKDHVALSRSEHDRLRLRTRYLLSQDKFPARVIDVRLIQKDGQLDGKKDLTVKVLMQRIEAALSVFQDKRRRLGLPVGTAAVLQGGERQRESYIHPQLLHPRIRD